jgi:hypothetical protein
MRLCAISVGRPRVFWLNVTTRGLKITAKVQEKVIVDYNNPKLLIFHALQSSSFSCVQNKFSANRAGSLPFQPY